MASESELEGVDWLLDQPESERLDFKREFHGNNVEFLHDVLCLANAYSERPRYLVFGINDEHVVVGIEADPRRRKNAEIQNLLRTANLNRIPTVRLLDLVHGKHDVSVLKIANRPDKPFFLTKDKLEGKARLRAGVVYTRIGDTNVPMEESAPEAMIELMWRERFGFGLSPLERFRRLLQHPTEWVAVEGDELLYHREFPEFTVADGEELVEDFVEPWANSFPDSRASSFQVELRYHATVLERLLFVRCDGLRYRLPAPDRLPDGTYQVSESSLRFLVASLYHQYRPLRGALEEAGITLTA